LNLRFFRSTVPRYGNFHLHGRVFVDGKIGRSGRDDSYTARLRRSDRRCRVATEKKLLNRNAVGHVHVKKFTQSLLNGEKALGKRCLGTRFDNAVIEYFESIVVVTEHAITRDGVTGIDA